MKPGTGKVLLARIVEGYRLIYKKLYQVPTGREP
jgi:hypothetical protein